MIEVAGSLNRGAGGKLIWGPRDRFLDSLLTLFGRFDAQSVVDGLREAHFASSRFAATQLRIIRPKVICSCRSETTQTQKRSKRASTV